VNVSEINDTFRCDCGYSWLRGKSGTHNCGDGLRQQIRALTIENLAQREVIEAVRAVAGQSDGIIGWHQNGTIAGWDEVLPEVFDLDMTDPSTVAARFIADVTDKGRIQGINFAASRLAAAFNHGFVDKPLAAVGDVVRMILDAKTDLTNGSLTAADGLSGEYAEQALNDWKEQLREEKA
jgi:hypothetical protein